MFVWSLVVTETVDVTELSGSHLHGAHREDGSCLYGVWWTLRLDVTELSGSHLHGSHREDGSCLYEVWWSLRLLMLQNCLGLIYTVHIEKMAHVCMESGGH